jgi:hypothetical protein
MQMSRPAQLGVIIVPGIRGRWRKSIRLLTRTRRNYRAANTRLADVQMRRATPNCSGRTPHRAANTRLADMQMPRPAHGECSRVNRCGNARGQAQGTAPTDSVAPHCTGRWPTTDPAAQRSAATDSVAPTSVHLMTACTGACPSLARGQAQGLAPTDSAALILLRESRSFSQRC